MGINYDDVRSFVRITNRGMRDWLNLMFDDRRLLSRFLCAEGVALLVVQLFIHRRNRNLLGPTGRFKFD